MRKFLAYTLSNIIGLSYSVLSGRKALSWNAVFARYLTELV